jgi:hypothetical protein
MRHSVVMAFRNCSKVVYRVGAIRILKLRGQTSSWHGGGEDRIFAGSLHTSQVPDSEYWHFPAFGLWVSFGVYIYTNKTYRDPMHLGIGAWGWFQAHNFGELLSANTATSERIVSVRWAPSFSSTKEAERTLLQTQEVEKSKILTHPNPYPWEI